MSGTKLRRARLADVARAAGVSESTVSRTLRDPTLVAEATRQRILAAVAATGYVPSYAARALASGRADVIGVLVPSVTNHVFTDVLEGIYSGIEGTGFDIQHGNTRYQPELEEGLLRVFLSQRPAGMIIAGVDQTDTSRRLLADAQCPVVQIMDIGPEPVDMMVGFSHEAAAHAATRHLVDAGYRNVAFLGAQMDPRTLRRFAGYRTALSEAGMFDAGRVETTADPSSVTAGAALFARLADRCPEVDAVFCNNDDLALGVLFEALRRGFDVPDRLGLCGFNDFEFAAASEPGITSVRTNRREMGRRAVELLLGRLDGKDPAARVVDLGFEVVARRSTAGRAAMPA